MGKSDRKWDKTLGIKTCGRDDSQSDQFKYPYEPTPYCVLERLAESKLIGKDNTVLDYGCGKGRVGIFLSAQTKCSSIGVECNQDVLQTAFSNQKASAYATQVSFLLCNAEEYDVPANVDRCFFFNPFSDKTLHKVLARITQSFWECPREILLLFYYPSQDFTEAMSFQDMFVLQESIDCTDLFPENGFRERIVVYRITSMDE